MKIYSKVKVITKGNEEYVVFQALFRKKGESTKKFDEMQIHIQDPILFDRNKTGTFKKRGNTFYTASERVPELHGSYIYLRGSNAGRDLDFVSNGLTHSGFVTPEDITECICALLKRETKYENVRINKSEKCYEDGGSDIILSVVTSTIVEVDHRFNYLVR